MDVLAADRRTFWQMVLLGGATFSGGAAVAVNPGVGAAAFLTVGVIAGATRTAWPSFVVARLCFAAHGLLPRRLMTFLHDSYERGVLRRTGAGYQFRHKELAEHLCREPAMPPGS